MPAFARCVARVPRVTAGGSGASPADGGFTTGRSAAPGSEGAMPQTNAAARGLSLAAAATVVGRGAGVVRGLGAGRAPLVATRRASPVNVTSTVPSVSVR
jgi:hypothetical protein